MQTHIFTILSNNIRYCESTKLQNTREFMHLFKLFFKFSFFIF